MRQRQPGQRMALEVFQQSATSDQRSVGSGRKSPLYWLLVTGCYLYVEKVEGDLVTVNYGEVEEIDLD